MYYLDKDCSFEDNLKLSIWHAWVGFHSCVTTNFKSMHMSSLNWILQGFLLCGKQWNLIFHLLLMEIVS